MRVDLRLQRAEFRLLAQCDLMLGLTELQHDGEKLRKALERFDIRVQHKVRPRRCNEKQRADDLFVRDEGGGQHGAAVPLRDLHYDRFPLGHRLARGNGKGSDRQVTAACGEHLCSVGQRDLKVRELFAHNVHRALKILAVADALSQIRQAFLRDQQRHCALLDKLDGEVAVQPVENAHEGDKADGVDDHLRQQDRLFERERREKRFGEQQNERRLHELGSDGQQN